MSGTEKKMVTFIQYDIPPLKAGEYTLTVEQTVNQEQANSFSTSAQFAVAGERFSFRPGEITSVYPKDLANGEFEGVLPHVILSRRTLPWERTSVKASLEAPWLAILLFNEDEAPTIQNVTAKDLIKSGEAITVAGSTVTGVGNLPADTFSYPGMNPLDYGELPDHACTVIDIALDTFNKIAPSAEDLPYLAHIREVDTTNSEDHTKSTVQYAIVIGNRVPQNNKTQHAFLVSLENLGDYLPDANGNPSGKIPASAKKVRLITYRNWRFTANTLNETFQKLLEDLNQTNGQNGLTTLQLPFTGTAPTPQQVQTAMNNQAAGTLTDEDAQVIVQNAFLMGYVPLDHHMRHADQSVSWYRGPLVPYPVQTSVSLPISCADSANRYDPQTGMFDVSYGAAWQLGQLLALQNKSYAASLYNWKKTISQQSVIAAEQQLLQEKLGDTTMFESLFHRRTYAFAQAQPQIPDDVVTWIAKLRLLSGVTFQYLVPDEQMLPPESMRFFYLDASWIDALVDGAFSIGRATTGELTQDSKHIQALKESSALVARTIRANRRAAVLADYQNTTGEVTGFVMRSQVVTNWTRLEVNGYADPEGNTPIPILRMERLSDNVLICLFDGEIQMVAVHEVPEELHSGVEGTDGIYTTTLRDVTGTPGKQFLTDPLGGEPVATVSVRDDKQTIQVKATADSIQTKLNHDFNQKLTKFTSAEFALEMVKGVVKVEFQQTTKKAGGSI